MSLLGPFRVTILSACKSFNIENEGIWTEHFKQNAFDLFKTQSKYLREGKAKENFNSIVNHFVKLKAH